MAKSKPKTKTQGPAPKKDASRGSAKKADASKPTKSTKGTAKKSKIQRDSDASALQPQHIKPRDLAAMQSKLMAANFGNIVTVLMQSPIHKSLPLSDLYHQVIPAIHNKQFNIAEAQNKATGATVPAAVALWARVSEEIDTRIVENIDKPIRLTAEEWNSGDIVWMMDLLGDSRFIAPMIKMLNKDIFKGAPVKYRTVDAEGVASIMLLKTPDV
jgi:cytolysin-activating lysine-acyltransferase